ncbi:MAG: hypothetical protein F4Z60_00260 [Chloroflexi bacterium]|nr:hypothetical protein [Chloroflexota bacterium]
MAKRNWARAWFRLRRRYVRELRGDVGEQLTLMGRAAVLEFEAGARDPLDLIPEVQAEELGQVVVQRLSSMNDDVVQAALDSYDKLPETLTVDISDLLDASRQRMVGVTDEVTQTVGRIEADEIRRDLPLSDIADGIQGVVDTPWKSLTVARTETSTVGNRTVARAWQESGVEQVTISDGSECGWSSHDDSLKADGLVRTVAAFDATPISHPNCQRTGFPKLG